MIDRTILRTIERMAPAACYRSPRNEYTSRFHKGLARAEEEGVGFYAGSGIWLIVGEKNPYLYAVDVEWLTCELIHPEPLSGHCALTFDNVSRLCHHLVTACYLETKREEAEGIRRNLNSYAKARMKVSTMPLHTPAPEPLRTYVERKRFS